MGLPAWLASPVGGTVLVLYGAMTGFGVSVCRAVGMYLLRMLGILIGRTYDTLTALGFVGALMAVFCPEWLCHMGYLLSFGSVLGLGLLMPALTRGKDEEEPAKPVQYVEGIWRRSLHKVWQFVCGVFREGLLAGVSITLTTLPIQLWFSYEISIYSVFLNALILPLMSVVMVAGLVAMIVPGLGVVGMVDVVILTGYEGLCYGFENLPNAIWNPGRPAVWQVAVYYLLWTAVVWVLPKIRRYGGLKKPAFRKWKGRCRLGQVVLLAASVGILALPRFDGDRVTFLDVGQGDCICIQLSTGEVYLFDCGSSSRRRIGEEVLIPFLKYYGINRIDAVFVSHGDLDHIIGVEELLSLGREAHIQVEQVVLPALENRGLAEAFGGILEAAELAEVPVNTIGAGGHWTCGEDAFMCVHPAAEKQAIGSNENSLCFYVVLRQGKQQLSLLLTGDVEAEGEEVLVDRLRQCEIRAVDVLKVAHHGSKNASSERFLEQAEPKLAVISCGRNNSYGHPHQETLERLAAVESRVVSTPEYGAITIEMGKDIRVYGFK